MIDELKLLLGNKNVLTEQEDIIPYGFDGTATLKQRPLAVVFPANTAEVAGVIKLARNTKTPVVTRGNGTGLSGGSVPVPGGLVLCLTRLNTIT